MRNIISNFFLINPAWWLLGWVVTVFLIFGMVACSQEEEAKSSVTSIVEVNGIVYEVEGEVTIVITDDGATLVVNHDNDKEEGIDSLMIN